MEKHVVLRKNEEHRILAGHQWVFSNEIASVKGEPESGDIVEVLSHQSKFLGKGFFNPHSLIAVRILTLLREEISFDFFERRISQALQLRKKLFPQSDVYRLAHSESDFLPGLIVDKYNEYLSIQTLSFGMDKRLQLLCDVLESIFHPRAIVECNDSALRALEHLPQHRRVIRGTLDETIIVEHGIKFKVDLLNGQKTGFFLDQRENRSRIRHYVRNGSVLDCFCYEGGFSLNAGAGKATSVAGIDQSSAVVAKARLNAHINDTNAVTFEVADVFDRLKELAHEHARFDVVILDPPSFTKSKKNVSTALRGYKEINQFALKIINAGGFLVSASCSHHLTQEAFLTAIEHAAQKAGRRIQLLEFSGASPDHPVLPAMPETSYLKCGVFSVQ
ncbi:MAG: class I SAM-dependent rRNA methyltransferase [Ignavibacteriales bacterium]|nr:class I SAM-dependent rRNA methyltransferase [Ignavibacteriales bacterium]